MSAVFLVPAQTEDYHDEDDNPPPVFTAAAAVLVAVSKLKAHGLTSFTTYYAGGGAMVNSEQITDSSWRNDGSMV
jgi:hypothetical protein